MHAATAKLVSEVQLELNRSSRLTTRRSAARKTPDPQLKVTLEVDIHHFETNVFFPFTYPNLRCPTYLMVKISDRLEYVKATMSLEVRKLEFSNFKCS